MDFKPKFELLSEQWPRNDDKVYDALLWDREFSILAGVQFEYTLELGHFAYYKLIWELKFFQVGFGIQDMLFERLPTHYCSLYYVDSRLMESSLNLETNTKKCALRSSLEDKLAWHYDSRDS